MVQNADMVRKNGVKINAEPPKNRENPAFEHLFSLEGFVLEGMFCKI